MPPTSRLHDLGAAGLSAALSGFELVRLIATRGVTPGYTVLNAMITGLTFCAVLVVAAVGLVLHRRFGWIFGVLGFLTALAHGIALRTGGNGIGIVYMLGGAALMALVVKSTHWYRTADEYERTYG